MAWVVLPEAWNKKAKGGGFLFIKFFQIKVLFDLETKKKIIERKEACRRTDTGPQGGGEGPVLQTSLATASVRL